MSGYNFDMEYKQSQIKMAKREKAMAEIRANVYRRMLEHKDKYPDFDFHAFMAWWDGLDEWNQRRNGRGNAATLNHLRQRDERLKRLKDKD